MQFIFCTVDPFKLYNLDRRGGTGLLSQLQEVNVERWRAQGQPVVIKDMPQKTKHNCLKKKMCNTGSLLVHRVLNTLQQAIL